MNSFTCTLLPWTQLHFSLWQPESVAITQDQRNTMPRTTFRLRSHRPHQWPANFSPPISTTGICADSARRKWCCIQATRWNRSTAREVEAGSTAGLCQGMHIAAHRPWPAPGFLGNSCDETMKGGGAIRCVCSTTRMGLLTVNNLCFHFRYQKHILDLLSSAQGRASGSFADFQNKFSVQHCNGPYFSILHELIVELHQHQDIFTSLFLKKRHPFLRVLLHSPPPNLALSSVPLSCWFNCLPVHFFVHGTTKMGKKKKTKKDLPILTEDKP